MKQEIKSEGVNLHSIKLKLEGLYQLLIPSHPPNVFFQAVSEYTKFILDRKPLQDHLARGMEADQKQWREILRLRKSVNEVDSRWIKSAFKEPGQGEDYTGAPPPDNKIACNDKIKEFRRESLTGCWRIMVYVDGVYRKVKQALPSDQFNDQVDWGLATSEMEKIKDMDFDRNVFNVYEYLGHAHKVHSFLLVQLSESNGEATNQVPQGGETLGTKELAQRYGVNHENLKKRLERYRRSNHDCFDEVRNTSSRSPRFIYKVRLIMPIIEKLKSREMSRKRPSRKKMH